MKEATITAPPPKAPTATQAAALNAIRETVGPKGWADRPVDMAPHLSEERGLWTGSATLVVKPASPQETASVVSICAKARLPIVPQGGNTSLVGGSVPDAGFGGIVLSTARMNRVREIDPLNNTITVDAGCVLADIQAAADEADRLFPLSLGAEGTCQIGGNISTNAGGTGVLRYGNTRDLVLGLEAVLPDGRLWNGLRGLRKNNTGYDLKHLFIGGEGTLGVITGAVLKLFPKPRDVQTAFAAISDPDGALELLSRLRGAIGDQVTGFEIMPRIGIASAVLHGDGIADPLSDPHDWYLLIEISGQSQDGTLRSALETVLAQAHEDGLMPDATIAESLDQARGFWRIRELVAEVQKRLGGSIKHDVSVPVSAVPRFLREATAAVERALPGVRVFAFGHVGDGNIHYNLSQPEGADRAAFMDQWERMNRIVHDIVESMGGSFSAEHGVGRLKIGEMQRYRSDAELDMMRAVKAALDPNGIMNPGRLV